MRVKMSKQAPPAPIASAVGPCPTVIQIVGRPGTGSLPSTIAPPDHPLAYWNFVKLTKFQHAPAYLMMLNFNKLDKISIGTTGATI